MPKFKNSVDYALLVVVMVLIMIGLVILYSASSYNGANRFGDEFYYLKRQLFATSIGITGMYVMAMVDYHVWTKFAVLGYIIALVLSLLVIFVGQEYNGSKRWLALGPISFQPSEFAKLAVVVFLSHLIVTWADRLKKLRWILLVMLLILPIVGLVGSNNLSTAVIILGISIILIFLATPKYAQFIWMGGIGGGFLAIFLGLESYRLERLAIWRNPELYEKGYQTLQGLYAIGSGGVFGRGLGESIQKLGFVPEAQNDMIFSIICEELGIVGASAVIFLFLLLLWRFYVVASHAKDLRGTLIAGGALAHIMIQVVLNIAVVTNTIPNTGITLPFISYGGTSVLFLLMEIGLVLNVSRQAQYR